MLYKEGKVDYLIPKGYHPITLKNTFSKILKRVIINYIADIAKNTPYYYKVKKELLNTISTYFTY